MNDIIKILQAYKNGKITEKELSLLLILKQRKTINIYKVKKNYVVSSHNVELMITPIKEEAESIKTEFQNLQKKCLE
jgi:hypothetical protein